MVDAWLKNNSWIVGWQDAVDHYQGLVSIRRLPHTLTHERRFRGADLLAGDPIKLAAGLYRQSRAGFAVAATLDYEEANVLYMLRWACSIKLDSPSRLF